MSRKKRRSSNYINVNNMDVSEYMPLKNIKPKTITQNKVMRSYNSEKNLMLIGSAGTGKTFLSMYLALKDVLSKDSLYKNVVVVRSAVATRDIGHLPGSLKDKIKIFEGPYINVCSELFGSDTAYEHLKSRGYIDFITTSYIRGKTLKDSIIIIDETQNLNFHELDTIITRIGQNCRVIFSGDIRQSDFNNYGEKCGIEKFIKILKNLNSFDIIEFTRNDIVRSTLVKEYIISKENLNIIA